MAPDALPLTAGAAADPSGHWPSPPDGWWTLEVAGVERPVLVGPGGVFVLLHRRHRTRAIGLDDPSPWPDRRHRMTTAQATAELTSQLLLAQSGVRIRVRPVVVVDSAGAVVPARPDDADVVHEDDLGRWLERRPPVLHERIVTLLVSACRHAPLPPAA